MCWLSRRSPLFVSASFDQCANWRRKLPVPIEKWESDRHFAELARRLSADGRA